MSSAHDKKIRSADGNAVRPASSGVFADIIETLSEKSLFAVVFVLCAALIAIVIFLLMR